MTLDYDDMFVVFARAVLAIKEGTELTVNYDWGEDSTTPTIACDAVLRVVS